MKGKGLKVKPFPFYDFYPCNAMRKTLLLLLLALVQLALGAFATLLLGNPALAAEPARGVEIFSHNCAACHLGGGNIIISDKSLHKQALMKHHIYSINAIAH